MSATVRQLDDGRWLVTCDTCTRTPGLPDHQTRAVTPFREVALRWVKTHTCPRPGRRTPA